ncbi:MAG: hypothetical protein H6Q86_4255, partial [candidate division NC10 bacterium]|nr:hypothetical protein [candidate division NC10 bacterium]
MLGRNLTQRRLFLVAALESLVTAGVKAAPFGGMDRAR